MRPRDKVSFPAAHPPETSVFHIREENQHSHYYFTWWQVSDTGEASQRLDGALVPCGVWEAGRWEETRDGSWSEGYHSLLISHQEPQGCSKGERSLWIHFWFLPGSPLFQHGWLSSLPVKMGCRARERCWGRYEIKYKGPQSLASVISGSSWHTVF